MFVLEINMKKIYLIVGIVFILFLIISVVAYFNYSKYNEDYKNSQIKQQIKSELEAQYGVGNISQEEVVGNDFSIKNPLTKINPRWSFQNSSGDEVAYMDHFGSIQGIGNLTFNNTVNGFGFFNYVGSSVTKVIKGFFIDLQVDNGINASIINGTTIYENGNRLALNSSLINYIQNNSGSIGYIPQFQDGSTINNSIIFQNGSKIGIGITAPLTNLDVRGAGGDVISIGGAAVVWALGFESSGGDPYIDARNTNRLRLKTGGTEWMRINELGKVGIGTTTPSQLLDVRGIGNFSGTVYINNGTDISTLGQTVWQNGTWVQLAGGITQQVNITNNVFINSTNVKIGNPNSSEFISIGTPTTTDITSYFKIKNSNNHTMFSVINGYDPDGVVSWNKEPGGTLTIGADYEDGRNQVANLILSAKNYVIIQGNLLPSSGLYLQRVADATSNATQKNSNKITLQNSLWNGSTALNSENYIQSTASTSVGMRSKIAFLVQDESLNVNERFSIWSNGDVIIPGSNQKLGIGTSTPSTTLDVNGSIITNSNLTVANNNNNSYVCYNVGCTAWTMYNGTTLITKIS